MKKLLSILPVFGLLLFTAAKLSSQPLTNGAAGSKICFYTAKQVLEDMLSGKQPLDYERAVFVTENAYYNNLFNYEDFENIIDANMFLINSLAEKCKNEASQDIKTTLLETEEIKKEKYRKAIYNYAIFKYMTDTIRYSFNCETYYHEPYTYSNKDPMATLSWSNSQVFSLLDFYSKQGNCYALSCLFKIFSERFNSEANLVTAPNHIFIQHADNKGIKYNIELATKAFPGCGSLQTITYTTDEAIKSGIVFRELDLKQSVALCLVYLAKGFENKFETKKDEFAMQCADLALKYDSLNLNAMLLKAGVLEESIINKNKSVAQLQADKDFKQYQNLVSKLYGLGYREMPLEMKNIIVSTILKDSTAKFPVKDHTPQSLPGLKNYNATCITLSSGVFEEVHERKAKEKFSRTVFDTKAGKIISFTKKDSLYNNYDFDVASMALSVDPLTRRYAMLSPYAYASNTPIMAIDLDGLEAVAIFGGADLGHTGLSSTMKTMEKDIKGYAKGIGIDPNKVMAFNTNPSGIEQEKNVAKKFIVDNYKKGEPIVIYGYSMGAFVARDVIDEIKKTNPEIKVDLFITIDPAFSIWSQPMKIPSNVGANFNFYQTDPTNIGSQGNPNFAEDENKTKIVNTNQTGTVTSDPSEAHALMDEKNLNMAEGLIKMKLNDSPTAAKKAENDKTAQPATPK